jgi:cobyric acid synthase
MAKKFNSWTVVRGAALALPVVAGATLGLSLPAQAQPSCTKAYTIKNGEGRSFLTKDLNLKGAPYSHCGSLSRVDKGAEFFWHCLFTNESGNAWVYGRLAGTQLHGWVWTGNLVGTFIDDNGNGKFDFEKCEAS